MSDDRPVAPGERAKAVAAVDILLRALSLARQCFPDDDLETVVVYLTVASASVGTVIRDMEFLERLGSEPLAPGLQRPIGARAVSASSGLPRETVRRKLKLLVAQDRILENEHGYSIMSDTLRRENNLQFGRGLIAELERAAGKLSKYDLGAFPPLPTA